jgi:hypothetical protein
MAIDFMVMPLSRYLTGDFITPNMRWAWEAKVPYSIISHEGTRPCPPNEPFGGPGAPERRPKSRELLLRDYATYPFDIPQQLWDEASMDEPTFHRVDPRSYEALIEWASTPRAAPAKLFGLVKPKGEPQELHMGLSLFLPCAFAAPWKMDSPFIDRWTGSSVSALTELRTHKLPKEARPAAETLQAALQDSVLLRMPMIVDS